MVADNRWWLAGAWTDMKVEGCMYDTSLVETLRAGVKLWPPRRVISVRAPGPQLVVDKKR